VLVKAAWEEDEWKSEVDADFSSFYLLHSSAALLVVIAKEAAHPRPF
jgi:hypothetical protein